MIETALMRSGLPGVDAALADTVSRRIEPVPVAPRAAAEAGGMLWPEGTGTTSRPALAYEARLVINAR
jgi:hypothetical protein